MSSPRCPLCGTMSRTTSHGKDRWYCHHCRMEFEPDDGDIGYGRPEKRLEREERRTERMAQK